MSKIKSKAIKNGYSFYQWSVTYGTASISGDALKVTNDDVTVEAQYKQNSVITINSNGGTYSGSTTKNTTVGTTIDIGSASKTGYTFTGWKVTNGTANISGNKVTPYSANVTVKAQYKDNRTRFEIDSWKDISNNIKNGNTSIYKVGDEKEVLIDGKDYTVRIANNSNYDCTLDSKTACGFVVEFVDIVKQTSMNSSDTNAGGWPATAMYKYLNGTYDSDTKKWNRTGTLYSKLPSDLQSVIANTTVISGHGSADKNTARTDHNWESTDMLYLLSPGEIYSNCLTENCYDTASYPYNGSGATTTRQLDYYNGVTREANYERAIKQLGGSTEWWWLRGAVAFDSDIFRGVHPGGEMYNIVARYDGGVAPAFRIA